MAFSNFTTFPNLKKPVARVFVRPLFSDIECDLIESTQKVPITGGFIQLFTGTGGVQLIPKKTVTKLGDQQRGDTVLIQDMMEYTLEIVVAQWSLPMLQDIILLDPSASGSKAYMSFKANRGYDITSKAVSFIIYDKQFDPTNDGTNVPAVVADSQMMVIYKASPSDAPAIILDNKEGTAKIVFDCLVSRSSGASAGSAGQMGAFTVA